MDPKTVEVSELCPQPLSESSQARMLSRVRDVYNHGTTLNNVAGNVYYLDHSNSSRGQNESDFPPQEQLSPTSSQTELPSQLYSRLLMRVGRGYPLMDAALPIELPSEYQSHGVMIGDVGIVTEDGYFDVFFNICEPADGSVNGGRVPKGFVRLERPSNASGLSGSRDNYRRGKSYEAGGCAVSDPGIQVAFSSSETQAIEYSFQCGSEAGAVLAIPLGASKEDLLRRKEFLDYAITHGVSWYEFVSDTLEHIVQNGSIYLITGFDKTSCWGTASFFPSPTLPRSEIHFASPRWRLSSRAFFKAGNTPLENQCIFLRGYKVTLSSRILGKIFGISIVETSPMDQITSQHNQSRFFSLFNIGNDFMPVLQNVLTKVGTPVKRPAPDEKSGMDRPNVTSTISPLSSTIHPSNLINLYLLSKFPECDLAISHDSVWCSHLKTEELSSATHVDQVPGSLFDYIDAKYTKVDKNGAIYLDTHSSETGYNVKAETSARNTVVRIGAEERHQLEGAPDPFPSLGSSVSGEKTKGRTNTSQSLDTSLETAFPSLSSTAPVSTTPQNSAWSSAAAPRLKHSSSKAPIFTDNFNLTALDLSTAGKDGTPTTLGDVIRQVTTKYKVKIEASTNQRSRQTTFRMKAESEKNLDEAKRSLVALLSPVVTSVLDAPASTVGSIIGPKGANLKQIRDQTSVRIDIPPRGSTQTSAVPAGSSETTPLPPTGGDEDEPMIPITLTGPQPLVMEARELLNEIIASKTSRSIQRVKDIPAHVLPFVAARKNDIINAASEQADISATVKWTAREIVVSGDRPTVSKVIETFQEKIEELENDLTSLKISIPKRQHRLVGSAIEEIMKKSGCAVVIADSDDPSEEVSVWGPRLKLSQGLQAVMEQAGSQHIETLALPAGDDAKHICTYLGRTGFVDTLSASHPDVSVHLPTLTAAENAIKDGKIVNVDLVGDQNKVKPVLAKLKEVVEKLSGGATRELEIDWLIHRVVKGKGAKKLEALRDQRNVQVFFPPESSESSSVLLVYNPTTSPTASANQEEKKKHLDEAEKEVKKLVADAADVKTEKVEVEEKWHDAVVGLNDTTLNAIIGEDKALSIKVGTEAGEVTRDIVVVRGTASDVDKAVKEILQIVEKAKNDEILNSYFTELEVDREYVGRIVGAQGAGVNKLRDQLGVKIDVSDEQDDGYKERYSGKKKGSSGHHLKAKVKITGREENVKEAKRRILSQVERLANETSETLKIPAQYHASLIGQSGKYAIRLEEKYGVKISFPRQSGGGSIRENLKPDEVLIKGGKKGVAGAKAELLDAAEFERESNITLKFTVPQRAVARILGKGGAQIKEIKDDTNAQIDIERSEDTKDGNSEVTITARGTKKAINDAKSAILAIAEQVYEEITLVLEVENKFHRAIIGAGGQGLRDLVAKSGGPADPKAQASLIRFPRQGEPSDEVRLRGEPKLVNRLKAELEKVVTELRDCVVLAVEIPQAQHRALIGRGGQHLNELQYKHNVRVQFPGSRSYNQVGEPENAADFEGVQTSNIVKVTGSRKACEEMIEELKGKVKPAATEGVSETVTVPFKYHHAVAQQGVLFRTLRSFGVNVGLPEQPPKLELPARPAPEGAATARTDEPKSVDENAISWEIVENYQGAQDGESTWTLNARDAAGLERATKHIQDAIEHAERMSKVGFLTLPDRSIFPRLVGAKGVNVATLGAETGADIRVGRDNNTIVIIGSENDIHAAKEAILNMANLGRTSRQ